MHFYILAFLFGSIIGSFLNVCIYRMPEGLSVVTPRSSCPHCGMVIRWYDNIPIFGWLILLAKCRGCKAPISIRYPAVEAITGIAALWTVYTFGPSIPSIIYFVFFACLIVITFIDIDHQIIPDLISIPGTFIFTACSAFLIPWVSPLESLLGALAGGGSLLLVAQTYKLIAKKDGMGLGDVKLLAMIGGLTGPAGVFFTIFAGSTTGTIAGLLVMLYSGRDFKTKIPFGPFLSIGAVIYIFWGDAIINWYFYRL